MWILHAVYVVNKELIVKPFLSTSSCEVLSPVSDYRTAVCPAIRGSVSLTSLDSDVQLCRSVPKE